VIQISEKGARLQFSVDNTEVKENFCIFRIALTSLSKVSIRHRLKQLQNHCLGLPSTFGERTRYCKPEKRANVVPLEGGKAGK